MTQRTSEETFQEEGHYPLGQKSREMVWNEPREVPTVSGYGKITGGFEESHFSGGVQWVLGCR